MSTEFKHLFNGYFQGKRVLVTGHTGFKGSWLSIWLIEMGAEVIGYSLDPYTEKDNFILSELSDKLVDIRGDIRDREKLKNVFDEYCPEIVFHLAAQPLVRLSYKIPLETYEINVMGTINILESVRNCPDTKSCILITTDKCYENKEQIWGYRENEPMGGYDPYSSSKGACEIAINSWRKSFFNPEEYEKHGKAVASVRAGNVIGGGDWAQDRIIPDCIRSLEESKSIGIRSPKSIRPWEHVLEPLSGYLLLAYKLSKMPKELAEGWNFGPELNSVVNVWDIASMVVEFYGTGSLDDLSDTKNVHEAKLLALDVSKARFKLGWKPTLNIQETVALTVDWYKRYIIEDVYQICVEHISDFVKKAHFDV